MPIDPERRQQLAAAMENRRLELRLTWQEVAERGGISLRALSSARTGPGDIRPLTRRGIDRGLEWAEGCGVDNILAGRGPRDAARPAPDPLLTEVERFAREMGVDPDGPLMPFVREVNEEVERAGEGAAGSQIFRGRPASEDEARIWEIPGVSRKAATVVIATMRAERAEYNAGQHNGRRGAAGLVLLAAPAWR